MWSGWWISAPSPALSHHRLMEPLFLIFLFICYCFLVAKLSLTLLGLQAQNLLCPWDFPGKVIGVSCHFFLQGFFSNTDIEPVSPALAGRFFNTQ